LVSGIFRGSGVDDSSLSGLKGLKGEAFDISNHSSIKEEEIGKGGKKQSLEEDNMLYRLAGVLVHSGTAECGHYYSYIKVDGDDGKTKWYEFNDTRVIPFELTDNNIRNEWFGGKTETKTSDFITDWQMEISKSAYMLFYEKVFDDTVKKTPTERKETFGETSEYKMSEFSPAREQIDIDERQNHSVEIIIELENSVQLADAQDAPIQTPPAEAISGPKPSSKTRVPKFFSQKIQKENYLFTQ
jgi:hypothetical protein